MLDLWKMRSLCCRLFAPVQPSVLSLLRTNVLAMQASTNSPVKSEWLLGSRVSMHLINDANYLSSISPYLGPNQITIGNDQIIPISNEGRGLLPNPSRKFNLTHVFHALQISYSLLFVQKLSRDNNFHVI